MLLIFCIGLLVDAFMLEQLEVNIFCSIGVIVFSSDHTVRFIFVEGNFLPAASITDANSLEEYRQLLREGHSTRC